MVNRDTTAGEEDHDAGRIVISGATGLIGHVMLANLLQRGRPCVCLSRAAEADAIARLAGLLAPFGLDARRLCTEGALSAVSCDLSREDVIDHPTLAGPIAALIHAAADTRFDETPDGAIRRTNVTGAENATRIAGALGADRFIFVSTAYVCGRTPGVIAEHVGWDHEANNDYEQSKRDAEQIVTAFGSRTGKPVVIARPSIVVGDSRSGRASKFTGFYLGVRSAAALARGIPEPERATAIVCAIHLALLSVVTWRFWGMGGCDRRALVLYPISVLLVLWVLIRAAWTLFVSRTVEWRGVRYRIDREGRIVAAS